MVDHATKYPASSLGTDTPPGAGVDYGDHRRNRHGMKHFSGQTVLAGIAAALAVQVVLGLFGLAIGLGSVSATDPDAAPSTDTVKLGASMWAAASILAAMFYGGFIAARLSKSSCHHEGILHGIVVWAGTVVVMMCLLSSAVAGAFGGAARLVGGTGALSVSGIKAATATTAPVTGLREDAMKREATDLIYGNAAPPASMSPDQVQADIVAQFGVLAAGGEGSATAHQRLAADLQTQGVSLADAEARVNDWQAKRDQARQKAKEAADRAAHATAKGAVAAGVVLLLAAFTSALGGSLGALHVKHHRQHHPNDAQQT